MHGKKKHAKMGATKKKALGGDPEDEDEDEDEAIAEVEEDDVDEDETEAELDSPESEQEEIAYMSPTELADLLTTTIGEVVSELGVTEKMQAVTKELRVIKRVINEMDERLTTSTKNVTTKEKNTATLLARIEQMDVRLKELEGETPKAFTKGYRSSQDDGTEIEEGHRLKGAQPADDPLDHFRLFLNGNK
jgi:chromosome segregation ATPase